MSRPTATTIFPSAWMAIPEIAAASMLFVPKGGSHQAAAAERGVHRDSWRAEKHPSEKPRSRQSARRGAQGITRADRIFLVGAYRCSTTRGEALLDNTPPGKGASFR